MSKKRKSGEGTLRLCKDGRWEARIVVGYNDKGLPIIKSATAKEKEKCLEKLERLKEQYRVTAAGNVKADMPFGDWMGLLVSAIRKTVDTADNTGALRKFNIQACDTGDRNNSAEQADAERSATVLCSTEDQRQNNTHRCIWKRVVRPHGAWVPFRMPQRIGKSR